LKVYADGQQVEQVSQFRYLGSLISEDGYCTKEIGDGKKVFMENSLAPHVTSAPSLAISRQGLKTFLFSKSYSDIHI